MGSNEDNTEGRGLRAVFALLLLVGIALSGYGLYQHFTYSAPNIDVPVNSSADADKARLIKMTENIQAAMDMRASSAGVVRNVQMVARYPFGAPVAAPAMVPAEVAIIPEENYVDVPPPPEIVPPYISVKGILSVGKEIVALMNIENEPDGKIYRVGDSFAEKKGKITKIAPNKVTVRYSGKDFEFAH